MDRSGPATRVLHGRDTERAAVRAQLARPASGRSGVLVIRGEAGVGKSALLADALAAADEFQVLRMVGVQAESELAFAGLSQLLAPVLGLLDRLPGPQAVALRGALGLAAAPGDPRFLAGAGTLSLLAEAAATQPLLCVVDDLQWVDQPSRAALAFAARRLEAEGVVLLLAWRQGEAPAEELNGLPELPLAALSPESAGALLTDQAGPKLAAAVRDRLVAAGAGNPLALVELAASLSDEQVAGRELLPDPLLPGPRLTQAYVARARELPPATQQALLVAAADDSGDPSTVLPAANRLRLEETALEAAETAGLLRVSAERVAFSHPLVRQAIYGAATFAQRRIAHQALAAVLDRAADADRRAWHLAAAAAAPDEHVAAALECTAQRARSRGGHAAEAAALERSALLTPGGGQRGRRLLAAAEAAWLAGQPTRAVALLGSAEPLLDDPADQARLAYLQGVAEISSGPPESGFRILVDAAAPATAAAPDLARAMLMEAARSAWMASDATRMAEVVRGLAALPAAGPDAAGGMPGFVRGAERLLAGEPEKAVAELRGAVTGMASATEPQQRAMAAIVAACLGDFATALDLAAAAVVECRRDAFGWLALALHIRAAIEAAAGRLPAAVADATEGLQLARDLGQQAPASVCHAVLAWVAAVRGQEPACREHAGAALANAAERRATPAAGIAMAALGLLELGKGRAEQALSSLLGLYTADGCTSHPLVLLITTGDLLEAAVLAGRPPSAEPAVRAAHDRFQRWAHAIGQPWALAVAARCRALLAAESADPRSPFDEAVSAHQNGAWPFEQARTALAYGVWLRRTRRPTDARAHLRTAAGTFAQLGATPWEDRAVAELRAAGETPRQLDPGTLTLLTPQELQIARIVRTGASNREAAANLYLSPRTVEYHLSKVYTKLGITSRAELFHLPLD